MPPCSMMAYQRLTAWRACDMLAHAVYRTTSGWPKNELYGLTSQVRRAAVSSACNLAEGSAKRGRGEYARFVDIAFGSLAEVHYLISFAKGEGFVSQSDFDELMRLHTDAGKKTWCLLAAVRTPR